MFHFFVSLRFLYSTPFSSGVLYNTRYVLIQPINQSINPDIILQRSLTHHPTIVKINYLIDPLKSQKQPDEGIISSIYPRIDIEHLPTASSRIQGLVTFRKKKSGDYHIRIYYSYSVRNFTRSWYKHLLAIEP